MSDREFILTVKKACEQNGEFYAKIVDVVDDEISKYSALGCKVAYGLLEMRLKSIWRRTWMRRRSNESVCKCAVCGKEISTLLINMNDYAYKVKNKVCCGYTCYRTLEKVRLAKCNVRINKQLQWHC